MNDKIESFWLSVIGYRLSGKKNPHRRRRWAFDAPQSSFLTTDHGPRTTDQGAFSLAELMVAIGILGIGMMIIATAFPVALDQTRQAVELQTSQMVCNEAVNILKTQIGWTELENYFASGTELGSGTGIYLLDLNNSLFTNTTFPDDCVYPSDNTYGWLAAVQKVPNTSQCYKFWIFVLREPSGIVDSSHSLKVQFENSPTIPTVSSATGRQINIGVNLNTRQYLLSQNGDILQVTEVTPSSNNCMLDRASGLSVGDHLTYIKGTGLTRKAPTVAVYQTVITY